MSLNPLSPEVLNAIGSLASVVGLGTSLAQWLDSVWRQQSTERQSHNATTIEDYLEWLRRKNHQDILAQISSSQKTLEEVASLIQTASAQSADDVNVLLERLRLLEGDIHTKLDAVSDGIDDLKRRLQLFPTTDSGADSAFDGFSRKYLERVERQLGHMTVLGVSEMRHLKQSLDLAYVSVNIKTNSHDEEEPQRAERALLQHAQLIIRGPAGSGKSTLLNWVALQCARYRSPDNPWAGGIPFLIPLRRLAEQDGGCPDVRGFVQYTLDPTLSALDQPPNWLDGVLFEKRAVILLDGVDELPASFRPAFWEWLATFVDTNPGNRVYVTSRNFPETGTTPQTQLWCPPPDFETAELDELSDADVRLFITNWHNAIIAQTEDPHEFRDLEDARDGLPGKLLEPANRRVRDLCRTPLLCAMVCVLHWREEGYLPSQRVKLYDRCCTMLIEERDEKRKIPLPTGPIRFLTLDDKEMILQQLALNMMRNKAGVCGQNQQIEISREEAISWIRPSLPNCQSAESRKCDAESLLNFLVERTGLLRQPAQNRIDFTHRTFQEYLAACAAGADNQAGHLAEHAHDDQWHETIILAAGTKVGGVPFGSALVEELLNRGEAASTPKQLRHTYYALAVACLETGRQIPEVLRNRVIRHLAEILPPRSKSDARALSAAGDYLLPLLKYHKWRIKGARVLAACARTIASIGGAAATGMLLDPKGYGSDRRATILAEICECPGITALKIPAVVSSLRDGGLPKTIAAYIDDIEGLGDHREIASLDFSHCTELEDLSPLSRLSNLEMLKFIHCDRVNNLEPLGHLSRLRFLYVTLSPAIVDIGPLAKCTNLRHLRLLGCRGVSNLSPVSSLTGLTYLDLEMSGIADLSPLASLADLQTLDLSRCTAVTSLEPVRSLSKLAAIYVGGTAVRDFSPLLSLPALRLVRCRQEQRALFPPELMHKAVLYF